MVMTTVVTGRMMVVMVVTRPSLCVRSNQAKQCCYSQDSAQH
jgi:hypothetical protein